MGQRPTLETKLAELANKFRFVGLGLAFAAWRRQRGDAASEGATDEDQALVAAALRGSPDV